MTDKEKQIIKTEIKPVGSRQVNVIHYICSCSTNDCNNTTSIRKNEFHKWSGLCKICSNKNKLKKAKKVWSGTNLKPYQALFNNFRSKVAQRNISCSISFEEFLELIKHPYCHYCYSYLHFSEFNTSKNGSRYQLDRCDNNLGYSKENCVLCCWKCNNSKSNRYSYEEWYEMNIKFRERFLYKQQQYNLWDNDFFD